MIDWLSDEQLVQASKNGDTKAQDYLLQKFKSLVKIKSSAYYMTGGDKEDIIQEGMIGLYKAIRDFNPERSISFFAFAGLCINRQIISAIKASTRQKHVPLNTSLALDKDELWACADANSPEALLIGREEKSDIEAQINAVLSEMECQVLALHLQGCRYVDIARILKKNVKSIDNALQRVRHKTEKILKMKAGKNQKISF